ncbi:class I SAM-dependent methyltransferase [Candidatus Aenigmatarchaeota archaeon]
MARDIDKGEWRAPDFVFRASEFLTGARDVLRRPKKILDELGVKEGHSVIDFFCGPGNFAIPAAEMVGEKGMVHAIDLHPLALETIEQKAERRGLNNIETIFSDIETGLPRESIDTVLLYGALHRIDEKRTLMREVSRVLRPGGLVSISDHRMSKENLLEMMKRSRFDLKDSKGGIFNFIKR